MGEDETGPAERQIGTARLTASVELLGANTTLASFADHMEAEIDLGHGLVYLTLAQIIKPDDAIVLRFAQTGETIQLTAIPVSRTAIPKERFRDWLDQMHDVYTLWFPTETESDDASTAASE